MNQTLLELDPLALAAPAPIDRIGFDIGFDHARLGLVPPPRLLQQQTAICQGWIAGKAVYGHRQVPTQRITRLWLALRLSAWSEGQGIDPQQLSRQQLAQVQVTVCPVRRTPLGGAPGCPDAAMIERLDPLQGYRIGNLVMLSAAAGQLWSGIDCQHARRLARRCEIEGVDIRGLDAGGWWRVAALRSFTAPLPFQALVSLPLAVWPSQNVAPVHPVQRLQRVVSAQFAGPRFSLRTRRLAALLPEGDLRHDFNLFVAALAARVLEADGVPAPQAVADAWLHERVRRRWQHLMLSLGEVGCQALLDSAEHMPSLRGCGGVASQKAATGQPLP